MNNLKSCFHGLLVLSGVTFAQTNKFDFGIEGGPSVISLRGTDKVEEFYKPAMGFSGGIFFQFNFKKIFSIRTNIAYERKGAVASIELTDHTGKPTGSVDIPSNLDYLIVPILLRASFGESFQFFLNTGPYMGYLMRQNEFNPVTLTPFYKTIDTGISAGLGLAIPIKSKIALSFEVRNNFGLDNINGDPSANAETIKTNSLNFLLGLTYKFGNRTPE